MYLHYNYILITVGSSIIGEELIRQLYTLKNQLILVSKNKEVLQHLKLRYPKINCIVCDLSDSKSLNALAHQCNTLFPVLDMIIHHDLDESDLQTKTLSQEVCEKTTKSVLLTEVLLPFLKNKSNGVLVLTKIIPIAKDRNLLELTEDQANSCSFTTYQKSLMDTSIILHYLPVKLRKTNSSQEKTKIYAKRLVNTFVTDLINDRLINQNQKIIKKDGILFRVKETLSLRYNRI